MVSTELYQCLKNERLLLIRKNSGAMFTDLLKYFDCLLHDLVVAKSRGYGFSMTAIRFAHNYLANLMHRTLINIEDSSWEEILFRVPHGFIMPLLLTIFYPVLLDKSSVLPQSLFP